MPKVTIDDISRETGLSRGTVSRALNDRPDISVSTKQLVLETCRRLNYVPSFAARSLALGRFLAVAVVVDDLRDQFAAGFVRGALSRASANRYAVTLTELGHERETIEDRILSLSAERIDGVLLSANLDQALTEKLSIAIGSRLLITTSPLPGRISDVLSTDFAEVGRTIGRALTVSGLPAVCLFEEASPGAAEIRRGLSDALAGAPRSNLELLTSDSSGAPVAEVCNRALSTLLAAKSIAATSDSAAITIALRLAREGKVAGEHYALLGCGNSPVCSQISPALTSIALGGNEAGERSVDLILQRLSDTRHDAPVSMSVAPRIVYRETMRAS